MFNLHLLQKQLFRFFFRQFLLRHRGSSAERELKKLGFHRNGPDTLAILDQGQLGQSQELHERILKTLQKLLTCNFCNCTIHYEWNKGKETFFSCYECGHLHPVKEERPIPKTVPNPKKEKQSV